MSTSKVLPMISLKSILSPSANLYASDKFSLPLCSISPLGRRSLNVSG